MIARRPRSLRAGGIVEQQVRRAMRRNHAHLMRHAQRSSRTAACCIVSQSEREPITTPTSGLASVDSWLLRSWRLPAAKRYSTDLPPGSHRHGSQAAGHPRLPRHAPTAGHARTPRPGRIERGDRHRQVRRIDDGPQAEALREALITRDRKRVYRVDDGIPVLLVEEGIATGQVADFPPA